MPKEKQFIDFTEFPVCLWRESAQISYLQNYIAVHSIIYYRLNESIISDHRFDFAAKQLKQMQDDADIDTLLESRYYYAFSDFNGSTGFGLFRKLSHQDYEKFLDIAQRVLKMYKDENKKN